MSTFDLSQKSLDSSPTSRPPVLFSTTPPKNCWRRGTGLYGCWRAKQARCSIKPKQPPTVSSISKARSNPVHIFHLFFEPRIINHWVSVKGILSFFFFGVFSKAAGVHHLHPHMDIPYPFECSYIFFFLRCLFIFILFGILRIPFHRTASEIATILTPPRRRLILELVGFFWSTTGRNICSVTRSDGDDCTLA